MNFGDYGVLYIVAQLLGVVALVLSLLSFQAKTRVGIIALQIISNSILVVQYFLLGYSTGEVYYSAVVANFIGLIRNAIYSMRGRWRISTSKLVPAIAIVLFIVSGIFTYDNPFDVLPIFSMCVSSVAFFMRDEKRIRFLSVLVIAPWVIYNVYALNFPGIVSDSLNLVSVLIAIVRFDIVAKLRRGGAGE